MTLFPEAQKKAQAEIDAVIGTHRLPTYADRESLPFVEAVIKEVLRWHVVAPLGMSCIFCIRMALPRCRLSSPCFGRRHPRGMLHLKGNRRDCQRLVRVVIWWHLSDIILLGRFMLHDPREYSDPMEFHPERFLGEHPELDPRAIAFGFGRRWVPDVVGIPWADPPL